MTTEASAAGAATEPATERPCFICPGTMRPGTLTHLEEQGGRVCLVERVPALICDTCGQSAFTLSVLETLDRFAAGAARPTRIVETPVYDYETGAGATLPARDG